MIQKWNFFFDVGLSVDPLDPQVYPSGPPGGRSIGDPCLILYPWLTVKASLLNDDCVIILIMYSIDKHVFNDIASCSKHNIQINKFLYQV